MKKFVGDFETSTWESNKTFVWAWALCEIGKEDNIQFGETIEDYIHTIAQEQNPVVYMHNLTFDRGISCLLFIKKWL